MRRLVLALSLLCPPGLEAINKMEVNGTIMIYHMVKARKSQICELWQGEVILPYHIK